MFRKYPKLRNSYDAKFVREWVEHNPELRDCAYWVTEKIHGCLDGKTPIFMADGSTKTIKDIVENRITDDVLGVDKDGNLVPTPITHHFDNGRGGEWVKIKWAMRSMHRGPACQTIKCTTAHRFYVDGQYIPASQLKVGDEVSVVRRDWPILSYVQEQVLIGKMLGDGCLAKSSITFGHKKSDEKYLEYTLKMLGDIAGNRQKNQISGYGTTIARARSKSSHAITVLFKDWATKSGKQVPSNLTLSPIALAFWYMDDGSLSHSKKQRDRANFATNAFTTESVNNLVKSLGLLGITAVVQNSPASNGNRIRVNADSAEILFSLIAPYIPRCMHRKLPKTYRVNTPMAYTCAKRNITKVTKQTVVSIEPIALRKRYDIETTTHNYVANGVLVHNSNYQVCVKPGGKITFGKRSGPITQYDKFFGHREAWKKIVNDFTKVKEYARAENVPVILHGELFGANIQKGVNYGEGRRIRFFDIRIDGRLVPQRKFTHLMYKWRICHLMVPALGIMRGLDAVLNFDTHINSLLIDLPDNEIEGIVAKPLDKVYKWADTYFILKKKNEKFKEKSLGKREKKSIEFPPHLLRFRVKFLEMVCKERLNSVVSKEGPCDSMLKMGKYIKLLVQDAREDFLLEFPEVAKLNKKEQKVIFNAGKQASIIVRKEIAESF